MPSPPQGARTMMTRKRALASWCLLAAGAATTGCGGLPPDAADPTDTVSAAAVAEQFFDTSQETQDLTGLTTYGIKSGRMEAFDVDLEAVFTVDISTPSSRSPRTKKGKLTYSVLGEKRQVSF